MYHIIQYDKPFYDNNGANKIRLFITWTQIVSVHSITINRTSITFKADKRMRFLYLFGAWCPLPFPVHDDTAVCIRTGVYTITRTS